MSWISKSLLGVGTAALIIGSTTAAFAVDNGIVNGDFEADTVGSTTITGWTPVNSRILLGTTAIAGCATVDNSTYSTLSDYATNDATYPGVQPSSDPTVNGDHSLADADFDSTPTFDTSVVDGAVTPQPGYERPGNVVQLFSDMESNSASEQDNSGLGGEGYVVHGPAIYSDVFSAKAIDDLKVDWAASEASDAYHVFAYLLNTDTCTQTTVIDSTGAGSDWQTQTVALPADGNYRFVFVSGTYDATWGGAAGAYLYLDNIILTPNAERAAAAEVPKLASTGASQAVPFGLAGLGLAAAGAIALAFRRRMTR